MQWKSEKGSHEKLHLHPQFSRPSDRRGKKKRFLIKKEEEGKKKIEGGNESKIEFLGFIVTPFVLSEHSTLISFFFSSFCTDLE